MYLHLIFHVCDHVTSCINSTTTRLYVAAVISVYRAGPPKIIGPKKGHAGEQHIVA